MFSPKQGISPISQVFAALLLTPALLRDWEVAGQNLPWKWPFLSFPWNRTFPSVNNDVRNALFSQEKQLENLATMDLELQNIAEKINSLRRG